MLKLLLDEHISPNVAKGLRRRNRSKDRPITVFAMRDWEGGSFLGQDDAACLTEGAAQELTLVTYDVRTIPPLLKNWAEEGRSHGGVIFVDYKTIAPSDIGGLVVALSGLAGEARDWDWADRVCFLRR
jgi:predicted alpha/beta-fold hydrolase